mmetsp:Transcript_129134/g.373805  ORF Transcript_129134/g.373805 Transcript_129134/m.373805 type:complete len:394 (+) Transcript_129134:2164-3345(+)
MPRSCGHEVLRLLAVDDRCPHRRRRGEHRGFGRVPRRLREVERGGCGLDRRPRRGALSPEAVGGPKGEELLRAAGLAGRDDRRLRHLRAGEPVPLLGRSRRRGGPIASRPRHVVDEVGRGSGLRDDGAEAPVASAEGSVAAEKVLLTTGERGARLPDLSDLADIPLSAGQGGEFPPLFREGIQQLAPRRRRRLLQAVPHPALQLRWRLEAFLANLPGMLLRPAASAADLPLGRRGPFAPAPQQHVWGARGPAAKHGRRLGGVAPATAIREQVRRQRRGRGAWLRRRSCPKLHEVAAGGLRQGRRRRGQLGREQQQERRLAVPRLGVFLVGGRRSVVGAPASRRAPDRPVCPQDLRDVGMQSAGSWWLIRCEGVSHQQRSAPSVGRRLPRPKLR